MLVKLNVNNYRCFDEHEIDLKKTSIIVGKNNAGKSTLIEALRLVSIIINRKINFTDSPDWMPMYKGIKGLSPSISGLDFSIQNIFHKYGEPPAEIVATFQNKVKINIFINEEAKIYTTIQKPNGNFVRSRREINNLKIPRINILPQISPIAREEKVLNKAYVKANLATYLSSRQFRNQIKYNYSYFEEFKKLAEETWKGLGIRELEGRSLREGLLTLIVSDGDFAAEIGWMGHGLQMWLQTMWFLAMQPKSSTVILDEPDVYMHADLQRKLIRLLKKQYKQVITATHSIEIMSEVEPQSILIIDKYKSKSSYASDIPGVQELINNIGSIQNIGLARIWSSRKFLLVEGKDIKILKRIQNTLFPNTNEPLDAVPNSSIGGASNWHLVKGANLVLKNGFRQSIKIYCILDSDYYADDFFHERMKEAKNARINLHIWRKKEIENYLIVPSAIFRLISKNKRNVKEITLDIVKKKIDELANEMKDETFDKISAKFGERDRKLNISTTNRYAREYIKKNWHDKLSIICGKTLLTKIKQWTQKEFGVSFSENNLSQELKIDEIDNELKDVINKIEKCDNF